MTSKTSPQVIRSIMVGNNEELGMKPTNEVGKPTSEVEKPGIQVESSYVQSY